MSGLLKAHKARKGTVKIWLKNADPAEVPALLWGSGSGASSGSGVLALHRVHLSEKREYAITHVQTGMALFQRGIYEKAKGIAVVECLLEHAEEDEWRFGEFGEVMLLKERPEAVQKAMHEAAEVLFPEIWERKERRS